MGEKTTNPSTETSLQIQQELEADISAAIEKAKRKAAADPYLGHPARRQRDDYYADVALHYLFLIACGAEVVSQRGGDVRKASKILQVGGTIARGWQKDDLDTQRIRLPKRPDTWDEDLRNREELRHSAHWLVSATVMNSLVEHICKENSEFRTHVSASIKARVPDDDSGSEQAQLFGGFIESFIKAVLGKPSNYG